MVPGTGISLQNRGYGFSVKPDHANVVAPRKRPFQTIHPGVCNAGWSTRHELRRHGGSMQAQAHTQMMTRLVDYHQNPQAASDAPRWRIDAGVKVGIEWRSPEWSTSCAREATS